MERKTRLRILSYTLAPSRFHKLSWGIQHLMNPLENTAVYLMVRCPHKAIALCESRDYALPLTTIMSSTRDNVEDIYEAQNEQRLDELHTKIRTLRGVSTRVDCLTSH
jgi:hypothetical protein